MSVDSFQADVSWSINGVPKGIIKQSLGHVPIMVKSKLCNLHGMSPKELIEHHEEAEVGYGNCTFKLSQDGFKYCPIIPASTLTGNGRLFHCEWN